MSQLFDVSNQSTIEQMATKEEIRVPWGTGIVGYVAESGAAVNIPDCYQVSQVQSDLRTQVYGPLVSNVGGRASPY